MVLVECALERLSLSPSDLLLSDAVVLRVEELVVVNGLVAFASPQSPGNDCKRTDENGTADASNHTTDNALA